MKIIYHRGDLDGIASGGLLKHAFPLAELHGAEFGDNIDELISSCEGENFVFMADFSIPLPKMVELASKVGRFVWIDHHWFIIKQYIENTALFPPTFTAYIGKEANDKSACELVFEYLYPGKDVPLFIQYLSQYDVWNHKDPDVLPFQYGARLHFDSPKSSTFAELLACIDDPDINDQGYSDYLVNEILLTGQTILDWQKQSAGFVAKEYAFEVEFEGYKAIVLNTPLKGSHEFDAVKTSGHDIMISFNQRPDRKWRVSIYTERDDVDVSVLASKYGGGGHKKAAGVIVDKLPF